MNTELQAWLANVDSSGATDEEFAEFVVGAYRMWKTGRTDIRLTADDMNHFPVDEFCEHMKNVLTEIIYSDEIDASAWWKKESSGISEENLQLFRADANWETGFGEPTLWIDLPQGRSLEIVLESDGLPEAEWYYSTRIHCSEEEFDNNAYSQTMGVIAESVWQNYDQEKMTEWANTQLR